MHIEILISHSTMGREKKRGQKKREKKKIN
jgi:hypothetical protein